MELKGRQNTVKILSHFKEKQQNAGKRRMKNKSNHICWQQQNQLELDGNYSIMMPCNHFHICRHNCSYFFNQPDQK